MKIEVNNKHQILSLGLSDIGSYLKLYKPLTIQWHDCAGSVGKFLSIIAPSKNQLLNFNVKLSSFLFKDFSNNILKLKEVLQPFLEILENGEYHIKFIRELKTSWSFQICSQTRIELENQIKEKINSNNENHAIAMVEKTTYCFYSADRTSLIATIPIEQINQERVREFELEILKGKRPFSIGISSFYQGDLDNDYIKKVGNCEADWNSEIYILDGHHKLKAYQNLKLNPAIALIHKEYKSVFEPKFDFDLIKSYMFKWQSEHMFNNWEGREKYENGKRTK